MSTLCAIRGCPGSCRGKKRGEKIYYFKALEDQLDEWNRVIPGDCKIKLCDRVCSRHFKDDDLIKEWNFVIDDQTVTMPRGRWTLRVGAVPAIFDNYKDDIRERMERKSKPKSLIDFGGSSSDEYENLRKNRTRKLKLTLSPKVVENSVKRVSKIPNTDLKSNTSSEDTSVPEPKEKSADQAADTTWDKVCDSFVDQLSFICASTPARVTNAEPAKHGRGRPRKGELGGPRKTQGGSGRKRGWPLGKPRKTEQNRKASLVSQIPSPQDCSARLERRNPSSSGYIPDSETENSVIIEEFVASVCDETIDVEILDDPDPSVQITFKCPSSVTVKEEKRDDADENYNSCNVATISEDSTVREQQTMQENQMNYEGAVVKREMCDCERGDAQCCGPQLNCHHTVLELPASPIPCEESNQSLEEPQIDAGENLQCLETEIDRNGRASKVAVPEVSIIPVSVSRVVSEVPESQHDADLEKLPRTSKNVRQVAGGSDVEKDFSGFSSDEEEELVAKRKHFQNTAEMAAKSTKLHFSRLSKLCSSAVNKSHKESWEPRHQTLRKRKSSVEMALDQLGDLESMLPVCSKKPANHMRNVKDCEERKDHTRNVKDSEELKDHVRNVKDPEERKGHTRNTKDSAPKTQEPSVPEGKFMNRSNAVKERLAPDFKCEVLKCGQISHEVTVTKAPKPRPRLDKVTSVPNINQRLDKVTSSSIADTPNLKPYSSKGNLTLNKVATPSNFPLKDKLTPSSNPELLQDKVTISSNGGLFKDQGTSTVEYEPVKDKIPATYSGPAQDRFSHLLNGSPLDRILHSTRSSLFLDSVSSHNPCDPTVDKTSLILKNFKTDGVLALECVVLKEQVRQLQKELFLHKQMLIDSEHNASLLQRRLELQAQLPCANCVNVRRGFIGKETLI